MVVGYQHFRKPPYIIIAKKHATTTRPHPPIFVIFVLPKVSLDQRMCGGSHASRTGKIVRLHGKHLHRKGRGQAARHAIPHPRGNKGGLLRYEFGGPDVFVERTYL